MLIDIRSPSRKYKTIYADPPWTFQTFSDEGKDRSPEKHYVCMNIDDIKALPVQGLADDDSVLLMWVTDPTLPLGLEVMEAWGFKYKTVGFTWAKLQKDTKGRREPAAGWTERSFFTGMGYWTRANAEMCLLGTRGKPKRIDKGVRRLVVAPRREHSRKPDEVYDRIERLCHGPYVELFARTERPGWDCWGNEVVKFSNQPPALVCD